jgi:hypothetical protein
LFISVVEVGWSPSPSPTHFVNKEKCQSFFYTSVYLILSYRKNHIIKMDDLSELDGDVLLCHKHILPPNITSHKVSLAMWRKKSFEVVL